MKYCDTRQNEYINYSKRLYIRENLINCYQKICKGEDINNIIKLHKKVITSMQLTGKNKINIKQLTIWNNIKILKIKLPLSWFYIIH